MNIHAASVQDDGLRDVKEQFVAACRILVNEGVSEAAFNVSVRISGDRMLTMPVTSPTLVETGNLLIAPIEPGASNWKAHPAIYLARRDVNAIVHVHAPYAIAFSTRDEDFRAIHHYGTPFPGKIGVEGEAGQTETADRAADLARRLGDGRILLQQAHGVTAVGKDLKEAVLLTLFFEEACRIYAIARQMGGRPTALSAERCAVISRQILKQRSQDKAWDHYVDKLTWRRRLA